MSKFSLELILKIVSAVIRAIISVVYGIGEEDDSSEVGRS